MDNEVKPTVPPPAEASPEEPKAELPQEDEFGALLARYDTRFDKAYAEALERSQEPEARGFSINEIPADVKDERMEQLRQKLEEYTDRLRTQWNDNKYLPFDGLSTSGRYKRDTMRLALKGVTVNTWALSRAYTDMDGGISGNRFENACSVVHEYIKSGGVGVQGGTGLPKVAPKI